MSLTVVKNELNLIISSSLLASSDDSLNKLPEVTLKQLIPVFYLHIFRKHTLRSSL